MTMWSNRSSFWSSLVTSLLVVGHTLSVGCCAFLSSSGGNVISPSVPPREFVILRAAKNTPPKYDKATGRWEATCDEEGYGPFGSLLRFGPVPFVKRLSEPDAYEQAVLKYMAQEKCERMDAQGNMDAYFENPNDWVLQKLEEKKGAAKRDYAALDGQKVVLTVVWAVLITSVICAGLNQLVSGEYCVNYPDARFCRVFG